MGTFDKKRGYFIFILMLAAIAGTFIGDFLGSTFKFLKFFKYTYEIGIHNPVCLDLKVLVINFAFIFKVNIMTIVGVALAIIVYNKY